MKRYFYLLIAALTVFQGISLQGSSQDSGSDILAESFEDFETGDFSKYEWQFAGNAEWFITDLNTFEGSYSAQSGDINDSQTSVLLLDYTVYAADTLSFWYKISTEASYDFLKFYIDDVLKDQWSGTVPWSYTEYLVGVGDHTFKWEYYKDFSISSGLDAVLIDMITFPPEEIEALFEADTTVICKDDVVSFTDLSIGPVTEWSWIFEGGVPGTSSQQNPQVTYPDPGTWDVFLEVTDGIETAYFSFADYIHVSAPPNQANTPIGISNLCASWGNTTYNTIPLGGNVTYYDWVLDPSDAGTISGNGGTNVTIIWEPDFLGVVELKVGGQNYCGIGAYSNQLTITRYLPEVSVILPAYVGLPEPPFELTGGSPPGGEYSGPGVTNGWFYPSVAGMGAHTITYTYTDLNACSNSATDVITVTQFIGIDERKAGEKFSLYPNPSDGSFVLVLDTEEQDLYDVRIYNTVSEIVFSEDRVLLGKGLQKEYRLPLVKGIYFVRLTNGDDELVRKFLVRP